MCRLIQFEYNEWFIFLIYKECCYSHHKKRLNPIFPNLYFCVFSHFYSVFHTFCCKTRKVVTCSVWLFFFVRCVHCASGIFETINRSFRALLEFKWKRMILVISHLCGKQYMILHNVLYGGPKPINMKKFLSWLHTVKILLNGCIKMHRHKLFTYTSFC